MERDEPWPPLVDVEEAPGPLRGSLLRAIPQPFGVRIGHVARVRLEDMPTVVSIVSKEPGAPCVRVAADEIPDVEMGVLRSTTRVIPVHEDRVVHHELFPRVVDGFHPIKGIVGIEGGDEVVLEFRSLLHQSLVGSNAVISEQLVLFAFGVVRADHPPHDFGVVSAPFLFLFGRKHVPGTRKFRSGVPVVEVAYLDKPVVLSLGEEVEGQRKDDGMVEGKVNITKHKSVAPHI